MTHSLARKIRRGVLFAPLVGIGIGLTSMANAQEVADGVIELEKTVVTGSLIPTVYDETSVPVTVVSRTEIDAVGVQTTSQLLQLVPQVMGSGNYRGEQVSNPGGGEASVALRGLAPTSTLVLINGRRIATTSGITSGSGYVNINAIPLAAIDRVEILREGASHIYGSDAMAGVVNIILKTNYTGAEVQVGYGNTTDTDASSVDVSFVSGISSDKGSMVISGYYWSRNGIDSRDRDIVKSSNYSNRGNLTLDANGDPTNAGLDWRSSAGATGRYWYTGSPGSGVTYQQGANVVGLPANYASFTSADRYDFREITNELIPQTRYGITANGNYKLAPQVTLFTEGWYNRVESESVAAPTPLFLSQEPLTLTDGTQRAIIIPADYIHNPFGVAVDPNVDGDVYRRFLDLGPRGHQTEVNTFRLLTGLRGTIADDYNWETAYLFSSDETTDVSQNLVNKLELNRQLQNNDPSIPSFNVFAPPSFNLTPAQSGALNALRIDALSKNRMEIQQVDFKVNGPLFTLPAGDLNAAVSTEYREEKIKFQPDSSSSSFNTIGSTNQTGYAGSRSVFSLAGELQVPIISKDQDVPFINTLNVFLAGRYEDYSDFGSTSKPGIRIEYKPIDDLLLRASYSEGFRAPTLDNLFQTGSESFEDLSNSNAPSQIQVRTLRSGSLQLNPEKSQSWNMGFVYSPSYIKGLKISADYYTIYVDNIIGLLNAQFVFDQYQANGSFADRVVVNPNTQYADLIYVPYSNLGRSVVRGIDYDISYVLPYEELGRYTVALNATHVLYYADTVEKDGAYFESAGDYNDVTGQNLPRNRGTTSLKWQYTDYQAFIALNYIEGTYEQPGWASERRRISDYFTLDAQFSWSGFWGTSITVGIQNMLDEKVPWVNEAASNGYDNTTYDITGRQYYIRLKKTF